MKKNLYFIFYILLFMFVSNIVFAQKVKTIEDEFNGTKYFETSSFIVAYDWNYSIEIRLKTGNGNTNIYVEVAVATGANNFFTVSKNHYVLLKFEDDSILSLNYDGYISQKGKTFGYMGSLGEAIRALALYNNQTMKNLTMIRVETDKGFLNLKVSKGNAKKLVESFNNLKKEIDKFYNQ
ncbi:hypothetical protein [Brachyspira pilosicoli]|uniref:hypothetical protein n=2 Tax=Brachyspira pilosicoli TaxID=52584 RepID=UPI003007066B